MTHFRTLLAACSLALIASSSLPLPADAQTANRPTQDDAGTIQNVKERAQRLRSRLRIIGGVPAAEGEIPWQAALLWTAPGDTTPATERFFCGGSFISRRWVLTAGHCVQYMIGAAQYHQVGGGSVDLLGSGMKFYRITDIVIHPRYNGEAIDYDYALIRIDSDFPGTFIEVVRSSDSSSVTPGTISTVSGWGVDASGNGQRRLRKVDVPIVARATCNSANWYDGLITDRMFCAGVKDKDSCQGDSGGPLTIAFAGVRRLVGEVSWGEGCALENRPGVYSRNLVVLDWIKANAR
jgi:secreted trypsin-like serine protease